MPDRAHTSPGQGAEGVATAATLVELLRLRAAAHPDRLLYTFLLDGEGEESHLTYGGLDARARAIAAELQRGRARGEPALLLYPTGPDLVAAFFGSRYAGAVPVPAYPPHQAQPGRIPQRLQAQASDARPAFVLTTGGLLARLANMPAWFEGLGAVR